MAWLNNILLVYPTIPNNTYWSFQYTLRFIGKKSGMPPLGLITMAALLPDRYHLKLIDMNIELLTEKDIEWADAVFVSAMIIQQDSLREVVTMCHRMSTPVVAGGPYPTASHEEIPGVDHFVLGEAETLLADFLADFENHSAKPIYRCQKRPALTDSPVPRFDLLKLDAYASMAIQYSRGCPFKCEFCDIWITYGNKPRLKPAQNIIRELDALYRLGWRDSIFIVDDNFIGNKPRVKKELLPALIQWQKDNHHACKFYTEASINMANDPDLMRAMATAGVDQVFIGIETPSQEALAETGKSQNLKCDLQEAVRTIQRHGIEVTAGFILGFDTETEDIFDRQIEFIQKTGIPKAMVGLIHALPGTLLYQRLQKEGRLAGRMFGSNTHCMSTNVVTRMPPDQLKNGYKRVLGTIYDANLKNYFTRCNLLLDNLKATGYSQRKIRLHEIRALLSSLMIQPLTPYGWQYLKFITRNLKKNPHLFAEVITHAVMGHHFHTITQETLKADQAVSRLDDIYTRVCDQLAPYSKSVKTATAGHRESLSELRFQCKKNLEKTKLRIDNIHNDFRQEVINKYQEIYENLRRLFTEAENDIARKTVEGDH